MPETLSTLKDIDNVRFWDDCDKSRLSIQKCDDCGKLRYPPRIICPSCLSDRFDWVKATGRGTVFAWVTVHHPPRAYLKEEVPYNLSLVELEEGIRMWSQVVGCLPSEVKVGMSVKVTFVSGRSDAKDLTLPFFEPL